MGLYEKVLDYQYDDFDITLELEQGRGILYAFKRHDSIEQYLWQMLMALYPDGYDIVQENSTQHRAYGKVNSESVQLFFDDAGHVVQLKKVILSETELDERLLTAFMCEFFYSAFWFWFDPFKL